MPDFKEMLMQPAGAMQSVAETFGRLMMESYSDDWEEDREYRARYEKRQRMRRERMRARRRSGKWQPHSSLTDQK